MISFLISYWWIIILLIAVAAVGGYYGYTFGTAPTEEQLTKVKEWLLYAVTAAEKELGSGTGQIKLRYVYDMFITKFSYLSKLISFETFSSLVDEVLSKFENLVANNDKLANYVNKEEEK